MVGVTSQGSEQREVRQSEDTRTSRVSNKTGTDAGTKIQAQEKRHTKAESAQVLAIP
ncbi:unnamed protein product [Staurois parvus]|uniref:Uncharacterized protein n=1 Tax=Staurois parvus TaxID=386267 RepID=A0ABN9FG54_9NEOB|nr:unnamed protein product [Staurois parvus]